MGKGKWSLFLLQCIYSQVIFFPNGVLEFFRRTPGLPTRHACACAVVKTDAAGVRLRTVLPSGYLHAAHLEFKSTSLIYHTLL